MIFLRIVARAAPQQPHIVSFRPSLPEFEQLNSHVEQIGMNRSDFVRRAVMSMALRNEFHRGWQCRKPLFYSLFWRSAETQRHIRHAL